MLLIGEVLKYLARINYLIISYLINHMVEKGETNKYTNA